MVMWAYHYGVRLDFSRPGKPTDNSFVETFNGSLWDECLNVNWFALLSEAQRLLEAWRWDYNESRPHSALEYLTPAEYARKIKELGPAEWLQDPLGLSFGLDQQRDRINSRRLLGMFGVKKTRRSLRGSLISPIVT